VLTDQLRASLASRTVIDQALGVIMAKQRCTSAEAFDILSVRIPEPQRQGPRGRRAGHHQHHRPAAAAVGRVRADGRRG
jgi:hypothetical protein